MLVCSEKKTDKLESYQSEILIRRQSEGRMLNKKFKFSADFKQFKKFCMPKIQVKKTLKIEPVNIHIKKFREKSRIVHKSVDRRQYFNKDIGLVNSTQNRKIPSFKCIDLMFIEHLNITKIKNPN